MNQDDIRKLREDAKARRDRIREDADSEYRETIAAINKIASLVGQAEKTISKDANPTVVKLPPATELRINNDSVLMPTVSASEVVQKIVMEVDPRQHFDVRFVLRKIRQTNPALAEHGREAVATAFRRIVAGEEFLLVKKGSGRRPSLYQRRERIQSATG